MYDPADHVDVPMTLRIVKHEMGEVGTIIRSCFFQAQEILVVDNKACDKLHYELLHSCQKRNMQY